MFKMPDKPVFSYYYYVYKLELFEKNIWTEANGMDTLK